MTYEVKKIYKLVGKHGDHYMPCGLNLFEQFWWRFVPGTVIKVQWPRGKIVVDHNDPRWCDLGGAVWVELDSADPNDFYRPWLEEHVGRQGWDWNWGFVGNDVSENCLTIKIRRSKDKYATIALLKWHD